MGAVDTAGQAADRRAGRPVCAEDHLVTARPDASRLLGAVAEALNACERAGITIGSPKVAVMTSHGDVLPIGDERLGARWAARARMPHEMSPATEGSDDD